MATSQARLLVRLRSKHAVPSRPIQGPPVIRQLQKCSQLIKTNKFRTLQKAILDLSTDYDALEKLSASQAKSTLGRASLKNILLKISSWNFPELIKFLSTVRLQDSPWSGTPYTRVVRKFEKLAQYVDAGRHLQHIIRKYPNWKIREVNNGPYAEHPNGAEPHDVVGLLTRMRTKSTANQRKQFMRSLEIGTGKTRDVIQSEIAERVRLECRVHAEIQLLYHYEQDQQVKVRPRIICSEKEACYLCYLFITTHGEFHTQRSHGNIYPRWRLPRFDELPLPKSSKRRINHTVTRFNQAIEVQILSCILQAPRRRPDPSESSVFQPGAYTPSMLSSRGKFGVNPVTGALSNSGSTSYAYNSGGPGRQPVESLVMDSRRPNPVVGQGEAKEVARPGELGELEESVLGGIHIPLLEVGRGSSSSLNYTSDQITVEESTHTKPICRDGQYRLSQGMAVEISISRGSSARFYTSGIRCEFIYGDEIVTTKTQAAVVEDVSVILQVEWLAIDRTTLGGEGTQPVDVTAPFLDTGEVTVNDIFEEHGLKISGNGCDILMHVIHQPTRFGGHCFPTA